MAKRILAVIVLLAVVSGAAYFVYNRYFVPEQERVRGVAESLIKHLTSDNVTYSALRIRDHLSKTYRHRGEGTNVTIDKPFVVRYVATLKQRFTDIEVEVVEMNVTVLGGSATVDLVGRVTAADKSGKRIEILTAPGRNRVRLELEKEDGDWLVVSSRRLAHDLDE